MMLLEGMKGPGKMETYLACLSALRALSKE